MHDCRVFVAFVYTFCRVCVHFTSSTWYAYPRILAHAWLHVTDIGMATGFSIEKPVVWRTFALRRVT
eukprot:SAG11_NODE_19750_length_459_cov_1.661111_1_plen_66_part_01